MAISTALVPSSSRSPSRSQSAATRTSSRPPLGSSSKRRSGAAASVTTIARRRRSPSESRPGDASIRCVTSRRCASTSARAASLDAISARAGRAPRRSPGSCGANLTRRSGAAMRSPSSTGSVAATRCKRVDLPLPVSPVSSVVVPRITARLDGPTVRCAAVARTSCTIGAPPVSALCISRQAGAVTGSAPVATTVPPSRRRCCAVAEFSSERSCDAITRVAPLSRSVDAKRSAERASRPPSGSSAINRSGDATRATSAAAAARSPPLKVLRLRSMRARSTAASRAHRSICERISSVGTCRDSSGSAASSKRSGSA